MEWYEALILGLIQGITEFLPISSSGHLELGSYLLNTDTSKNLLFSIIVHIATAISIVYVFKKDIYNLIIGFLSFKKNKESEFILKIIISSIPVAIIGLLYEEKIEKLFSGNITLVGSMLLITSLILFLTFFQKNNSKQNITYLSAFIIGIAQSIAIFPGISRSGATICTALFLKINKEEATKFSFIMVLVPIFGILLLKIYKGLMTPGVINYSDDILIYLIGFISALISGVIACKMMIKIVKESKLIYFAFYCLIIGSFSLLFGFKNNENSLFTIKPIMSIEDLRNIALKSSPPEVYSEDDTINLVDIESLNNSIKLDIRYATKNNFMQTKFYKQPKAFLNYAPAQNLISAHKELNDFGYGIVIYDAYRPWFITKMFWEGTPNELKHFVADPNKGSVHNRGCAVDIGLYDLKTEKIIKMISGYDEFSEKAYPDYPGGTLEERKIRDLLIDIMNKNNFDVYEYEWWHFDFQNCNSKVLNYSFEELDSLIS